MSPEHTPTTPETNNEKPYVSKAQEVIARAAANAPETTARFEVIDTFVDDILQAARDGEISGSNGAYTEEDLLDQLVSFKKHAYSNVENAAGADKEVIDPFMLIPRASGLRDAFRTLWANEATHTDLEQAILLRSPEAQAELRSELLSTARLEDIGEVGLNAAEVKRPLIDKVPDSIMSPVQPVEDEAVTPEAPKITKEEYLSTLTEGLSEDVIHSLDAYALSKFAQNRAQANGEYDNVAHYKREVHENFKRLPKDVQKFADRYAHAANYYQ